MNIRYFFLAVFGLLTLAVGTANAASCERVWGYQDPAVLQDKFGAVVARTAIPGKPSELDAIKLGRLLIGYANHNCAERFAALPTAAKTPKGFLQHVGILSKGKPADKVYKDLLWMQMQRGVALKLPSSAEVARKVKEGATALAADLKQGHVSPNLRIRIREIEALTRNNNKLRSALYALRRGFAELEKGNLPPAVAASIEAMIQRKLEAGLIELRAKLADQERQLKRHGELIATHTDRLTKLEADLAAEQNRNKAQADEVPVLKNGFNQLKGKVEEQQLTIYLLMGALFLGLLALLGKVVRDRRVHAKLAVEQEALAGLVKDLSAIEISDKELDQIVAAIEKEDMPPQAA